LIVNFFGTENLFALNIHKKEIERRFEKIAFFECIKIRNLNFIFLKDKEIFQLNCKYLHHFYSTDIITFNYDYKNTVNGDIYISIEKVKRNSVVYNSKLRNELFRVMIHGILHLIGYNDKKYKEILIMRKKENYYLKLFN